ncbi:MAG TPA: peptidoglycan-binding protein [Candidatus Stackebrandtia faecavium]|nr:peptidoglycan-binding protein [Candidatus Stackebrandtia faecavium]
MKRIKILVAGVAFLAMAAAGGTHVFADDVAASSDETGPQIAAGPDADELRDRVSGCETQLSDGEYAENDGDAADIAVCESGGAVHWKADFDVDCDGQRSDQCNENTDPWYQPETAFPQSDGEPLNSATLPHVVVPGVSDIWSYKDAGIGGGTVAAVVFEDKVAYAVVGDVGPQTAIGEGSYALAEQLGIDPDPQSGGIGGKVVDFILFPDATADPIEDHDDAVAKGEEAANGLLQGCGKFGFEAYENLEQGAEGDQVKAAQCLLDDAGFAVGDSGATGEFDEDTTKAVTAFQADRGLDESGVLDPHTWTALLAQGDSPELTEGSEGAPVQRLQRALTAASGETIAQDGVFGPQTTEAVEGYQNAVGLTVDGVVGAQTWKALQNGE